MHTKLCIHNLIKNINLLNPVLINGFTKFLRNLEIINCNMDYRSGCPISNLVDLVGDKWSLLIIRDFFLDRNTFKQFMESPEAIATNILTDRLKSLKSKGIIDFAFAPNNKKTKYYYLTDMGIDLYPVIYEMAMWSRRNLDKEFNEVATDWFTDNINKEGREVKEKSVEEYKIIRQDLFELVQA